MRGRLRLCILVVTLTMPVLSVAALGAGAADQATQQVAGGGVTVTATLVKGQADTTTIRLAFNTHSVNLDAYNFADLATLRDDNGKVYPVEAVEKASGGGHHRQAVLQFAKLNPDVKTIELDVKDVAGVKDRIFRWDIAE